MALASRLFAPHYARAQRGWLAEASMMLRAAPDADAITVSQLVLGEEFDIVDLSAGWAWGRCVHDGYVGYLPADALGGPRGATHRVRAPLAPVFAKPDIKAPAILSWPIGARFEACDHGDFLATDRGFVHARHADALDAPALDPVATALALVGQPYLWGGRGAGGVDCSGLVQVALGLAGIDAPRDCDLQRDALGRELGEGERLRRGDLVYFPGHVGMMIDGHGLLHANAYWMAVVVEPLVDVIARLEPAYPHPVLARRRLELP